MRLTLTRLSSEFDGAEAPAAQMRALGCDRRVISGDEAERIEPVLAPIRAQLAGATYTSEDESGDANRFARELFLRRREDGVQFLMNHTATAVCEAGGAIDHVEATDREGRLQRLRADAYVLAMGSLSSLFAAPLSQTARVVEALRAKVEEQGPAFAEDPAAEAPSAEAEAEAAADEPADAPAEAETPETTEA